MYIYIYIILNNREGVRQEDRRRAGLLRQGCLLSAIFMCRQPRCVYTFHLGQLFYLVAAVLARFGYIFVLVSLVQPSLFDTFIMFGFG